MIHLLAKKVNHIRRIKGIPIWVRTHGPKTSLFQKKARPFGPGFFYWIEGKVCGVTDPTPHKLTTLNPCISLAHLRRMGEGFNILINRKSGTVLNMGEPAIEAAITASEIPVAELCMSEPDDMQANLERLSKRPERLLIGGGDGTIRETAKYLAAHKKAFGVLPFGTMNLLAVDLGFTSLATGAWTPMPGAHCEQTMDAGFVNGEIFLCCASIGTMPQASVYREARRMTNKFLLLPQMFLFVADNMKRHRHERIVLEENGVMTQISHAGSGGLRQSLRRLGKADREQFQADFAFRRRTGGLYFQHQIADRPYPPAMAADLRSLAERPRPDRTHRPALQDLEPASQAAGLDRWRSHETEISIGLHPETRFCSPADAGRTGVVMTARQWLDTRIRRLPAPFRQEWRALLLFGIILLRRRLAVLRGHRGSLS